MAVRIWVRGGLGNQLCSLAAGATVARSQKDSTLVLDGAVVANSTDSSRRYFLDRIRLEVPGLRITHANTEQSLGSRASQATRRVIGTLSRKGVMGGVVDYLPEDGTDLLRTTQRIRFMDGHYEVPEIAVKLSEMGLAAPLSLLDPSKDVKQAVASIRHSDLAVHVRLGDFRTHLRGSMMLDANFYGRAIRTAITRGAFDRVMVFSEEPEAAASILRKTVPKNLEISPVPIRAPQESLWEMSMFSGIVASRSSYSWWAAFMGHSDVVVGPADSNFFRYVAEDRGWILVRP